jgi:hypothetical protein
MVDLSDFWDNMLEFVGVVKLWESRFDEWDLKKAVSLSSIESNR